MSTSTLNATLTIFTIVTGSLSLVGSSLLILTILRSKKKLSVPYRRLIFGTSVYDVFQSLGLTTSIFLSPEGTAEWAVGNTATCDVQGLFTTMGAIGVPIYLCSLCIYYFCIIRLNMKKSTFKEIEPFLHAVPILYSMFCGFFALSNQYFNNAGSVCYVAPQPITCEIFPDQECTRGEGASRFRLLFLTYPSMVILVIVCIIMGVITYYAKKVEKRRTRYSFSNTQRFSLPQSSFHNGTEQFQASPSPETGPLSPSRKIMNAICFWRPGSSPTNNGNNMSSVAFDNSSVALSASAGFSATANSGSIRRRRSQKSKDRISEINKQALLYIGSYILSYGFVWAMSLHSLATKKPPLTWLRVLSSIFFPLQGFINIFIYCRPHIVSLRTRFPDEYTWFRAFVMVLKSGGDDPLTVHERRISSMRRFQSSRVSQSSRVPSDKSLMEMDSDSSSSGSNPAVTLTSGKISNTTLPTVCPDIENQSGDSIDDDHSDGVDDDDDLVDGIPVDLESIVHNTEKMLDDTIAEIMNLADGKTPEERKDESDNDDCVEDDMDDDYSAVSNIAAPIDNRDATCTADETSAVKTITAQQQEDGTGPALITANDDEDSAV